MQNIAKKRMQAIQVRTTNILNRLDPQCDEISLQAMRDLVNSSTPDELAKLLFMVGCDAEVIGGEADDYFEDMAEQMAYEKESSEALKNQLKFIQEAFERKLR